MKWDEYSEWCQGAETLPYYKMLLDDAAERPGRDAERKKVVHADEFPWENSPHGLLKHLVNEAMDTRCETVNDLQQYETAPEYNPSEVLTAELVERYLYAKA